MRTITRPFLAFACAAGCLGLQVGMPVNGIWRGDARAQEAPQPRESGADAIRRRQIEQANQEGDSTGRYWTPFELARDGKCEDAAEDLSRMANRGRGYENAQHTYGLCLLETGKRSEGLVWIDRAADAGLADAQATRLRLYAQEGTAYLSHKSAAMWLYLYQNNPMRLRIGSRHALAPLMAETIRDSIPRADYLAGIDMARNWTPVFWSQTAATPDATTKDHPIP